MGNECIGTTPNKQYESYLEQVDVAQLKDLWQSNKVHKLKEIFDEASDYDGSAETNTLTYQSFASLFPGLEHYQPPQIQRVYQIFDYQNQGFVDWNSFFSAVTLCYFAPEHILAVVMFMMFDATLDKQLPKNTVKMMIERNDVFLKEVENQQVDVEQVCKQILKGTSMLTVQSWTSRAQDFFDFSKFRRVFNVLREEQMEKELIANFTEWNNLYNESSEKQVGYLVSYKWFEAWQLYVQHNYNVLINPNHKAQHTVKSVKSIKRSMTRSVKTRKRLDTVKDMHGCRAFMMAREQGESMVKDIDCVHSHLGERPFSITNNLLEGEYEQVLKAELTQNKDYVLVSEQVWQYLCDIYDAKPQFCRTGREAIQLYPKMVHIYPSLIQNQIDYSAELLRQASARLDLPTFIEKSCEIEVSKIKDYRLFYKTCEMPVWEQVKDTSMNLGDLSPQIIIYLAFLPKKEAQVFAKSCKKMPTMVTQVNVGDSLIYSDKTKGQKKVIFLGKNIEGKFMLHFAGEPYTSDICLLEHELVKKCKLPSTGTKTEKAGGKGLPYGPDTAFLSSLLMQMLARPDLKSRLWPMLNTDGSALVQKLALLFQNSRQGQQIKLQTIRTLVIDHLPQYKEFEVTMAAGLVQEFFQKLASNLKKLQVPALFEKYQVKLERKVECLKCKQKITTNQTPYLLQVPLPHQKNQLFSVVWVPAAHKNQPLSQHQFTVPASCTLGGLMMAFEKAAGVQSRPYILTEVQGHDIIRNYHSSSRETSLEQLKIRQDDELYAYQLITDLNNFVKNHFSPKVVLEEFQIKKDQFIDCNHQSKGWIVGRVADIEYLPYTHVTFLKVLHKFNKNQSWQVTYDTFQNSIARFPLQSHRNAQHFHIRVQQRIFNESSNSMQLVNMPLIIVLPSWIRWKQFYVFLYLQMKRFIAEEYSFNEQKQNQFHQNMKKKTVNKKDMAKKTQKFKDYQKGDRFPYTLRLSDYEGRCIHCCKFLKSDVFNGESTVYCSGCKYSQTEPISWQVKPNDLVVCVDWHGPDRFRTDLLKEGKKKTKQVEVSLTQCVGLLKQPSITLEDNICCNKQSDKSTTEKLLQAPEQLTIQIERIVEERNGFKRVINQHVRFPLRGFEIAGKKYQLVGMTSIEGGAKNLSYKTYCLQDGDWRQYDGRQGRRVEEASVEKQCAFLLSYQSY